MAKLAIWPEIFQVANVVREAMHVLVVVVVVVMPMHCYVIIIAIATIMTHFASSLTNDSQQTMARFSVIRWAAARLDKENESHRLGILHFATLSPASSRMPPTRQDILLRLARPLAKHLSITHAIIRFPRIDSCDDSCVGVRLFKVPA